MKGEEIRENFVSQLVQQYSEREATNIFYVIVDHLFGLNRVEWGGQRSNSELEQFQSFTDLNLPKLLAGKPIQQILGKTWFHDMEFEVNEHVLIPRPETEELVQWVLDSEPASSRVGLDVGTGSGCIPLAIVKKRPQLRMRAWDISEDALKVAKINQEKHSLDGVQFEHMDVLAHPPEEKWDFIVSNPPYIPINEADMLDENVREHEPEVALFVPTKDPLLFYIAIAKYAFDHLNEGGSLYFECHEDYANKVAEELRRGGFRTVELKQDMQGKDRMIRAQV